MPLNPEIYEYFKQKYLREQMPSEETRLLRQIAEQTSDKKGILQNVAGNFISDGVIYLLRKFFFRG